MINKVGFVNEHYLEKQSEAIIERIQRYDNKLYLEFGGKLLFDYHAARVLPGYNPNIKMRLLQNLKDKAEIIICIYAGDIERRKLRADFGITYDVDALKLIDDIRDWGLEVSGVVITRYDNQASANIFKNKLERRGIKVYTHCRTPGYPTDIDLIVSDKGYGVNEYIPSGKPLVVVTGPGPGSGKLATCLSQMYHDYKGGRKSGYAKFETFPIWDLPLKHPVNLAYEAATADIGDFNLIDPFHLENCHESAVNYNRDVEVFPILRRILTKLTSGTDFYRSPTEMGVNRVSYGIVDDNVIREASKQEIIRRYFRYKYEYAMGFVDGDTVERAELLMEELNIKPEDRTVVIPARKAAEEAVMKAKGDKGIFCGASLELPDGTIVTGKNSPLLHASSSLILNVIKILAGIPHEVTLLPEEIIASVASLKKDILQAKTLSLDLEETLISLSIGAAASSKIKEALNQVKKLRGCEMHMTHVPTPGDEAGLKRLGVNLTCDPNFSSKNLFSF
ncbi:MAG: DUF1846 domain-containing protein [Candidatus Aminicenantes bacterium]|nr:DUF1846 domain-containing protein [Candidatus Aminicenantes bacterium]